MPREKSHGQLNNLHTKGGKYKQTTEKAIRMKYAKKILPGAQNLLQRARASQIRVAERASCEHEHALEPGIAYIRGIYFPEQNTGEPWQRMMPQ